MRRTVRDHVDAHRSMALVVSKYAPKAADGKAFVDSRFYTTVSMVRTMEMVLGLPPMNNNDAFSSAMTPEFTGPGDQPPFEADYANRDNGLIYTANKKNAPGARRQRKDGLSPCGPRRRAEAERYSMEGCDGRPAGSGTVAGASKENE